MYNLIYQQNECEQSAQACVKNLEIREFTKCTNMSLSELTNFIQPEKWENLIENRRIIYQQVFSLSFSKVFVVKNMMWFTFFTCAKN